MRTPFGMRSGVLGGGFAARIWTSWTSKFGNMKERPTDQPEVLLRWWLGKPDKPNFWSCKLKCTWKCGCMQDLKRSQRNHPTLELAAMRDDFCYQMWEDHVQSLERRLPLLPSQPRIFAHIIRFSHTYIITSQLQLPQGDSMIRSGTSRKESNAADTKLS